MINFFKFGKKKEEIHAYNINVNDLQSWITSQELSKFEDLMLDVKSTIDNIKSDVNNINDNAKKLLDLIPKGYYQKLDQVDLNKPIKIKNDTYDAIMCVGTFTYGHVKPQALDEFVRITKNNGFICFTINEGIYEEYGFDKKIEELKRNKKWNIKEFFKSDYIKSKDVNAWLCLAEVTK